jgi:hypothetical protein
VLEERVYRKYVSLTPLNMNAYLIFWKNLMVILTIPIFLYIPVSVNVCSSGVLENNRDAIFEVVHNNMLIGLLLACMITFVFNSFLSL